jgi:hypothetical protein
VNLIHLFWWLYGTGTANPHVHLHIACHWWHHRKVCEIQI